MGERPKGNVKIGLNVGALLAFTLSYRKWIERSNEI